MIYLRDILPIDRPQDFKVHFAKWNREYQPLEVLTRSAEEWQGWQEYYPGRNDFNRPKIFSLARFYHQPDAWLFGGIFRVLGRSADGYEVELSELAAPFIRRLKLRSNYGSRLVRVDFENHYAGMEVIEVLAEPYAGRAFPGFEDVDLSFEELKTLVRRGRLDWQTALQSVKGVYLITDVSTRRRYVGSACGDGGLWARWCQYVETGHGGNVELRQLVTDPTLDYCRKHFRFALLAHRAARTPDDVILARESFWKKVLFSDLNRN